MIPDVKALLAAVLLALPAGAAEQTLRLTIEGWHSKGDAYKTEQAVRAVKGVASTASDAAKKQLTVVYDDATASPAAIEKAISSAGYLAHR